MMHHDAMCRVGGVVAMSGAVLAQAPSPGVANGGLMLGAAGIFAAVTPWVMRLFDHLDKRAAARREADDLKVQNEALLGEVRHLIAMNTARLTVDEARSEAILGRLREKGIIAPQPSVPAGEMLKLPRPTLLIVEDDPETAKLLMKLFTAHGFSTHYAPDLSIAREKLAKGPHWMVLDLEMGDEDGLDLLRTVRAEGLHTRVAVVTGSANLEHIAEAKALTPDFFASKPIPYNALLSKMLEPASGAATDPKEIQRWADDGGPPP